MTGPVWQLELVVPAAGVTGFESALDDGPLAVSTFEIEGTGLWRIEALYPTEPDLPALEAALDARAQTIGLAMPALHLEALSDRDWVSESLTQQDPVAAGRFFVHGSHLAAPADPGRIALCVDAGAAFGTGSHGTTKGCLMAIDDLARARRFRRPLDLGCGTAVLAMAMARRFHCPVLASDIDPVAVTVAQENIYKNRLSGRVRAVTADGFAAPALRNGAPYDLIVANILARPLAALAPALTAALTGDGVAILSGLLAHQEASLRAVYRNCGLAFRRRYALGEWRVLVLAKKTGGGS